MPNLVTMPAPLPIAGGAAAPRQNGAVPGFSHAAHAAAALLCAALVGWLLSPTAGSLWQRWLHDADASHGFVVVAAAAAMAWAGCRSGALEARLATAPGEFAQSLITLALGWLLHSTGWFCDSLLLATVGAVLVLRSAAMAWASPEIAGRLRFPLWFLVFAAPLPIAWHQGLSRLLQAIASRTAEEGLALCGVATLRSGNILQLPGYTLEVGEACSGLRQLTAMLAMAAAVAYLTGRRLRYRAALVALAIPVAVVSNCVRAMLTGLVLVGLGPAWAEGVAHSLEGMGMAALGGALLLALAGLLKRLDSRGAAEWPARYRPMHGAHTAAPDPQEARRPRWHVPGPKSAAGFTALVLVVAGLHFRLERHLHAAGRPEPSPIYNPLAALPHELGQWRGEDLPIHDARWHYADEHLQRVYRHAETGQLVWVWLAYSATGADRGHHPEVCQRVAGKQEDLTGRSVVELTGAGPGAQEYRFHDATGAQQILYWHYSLPAAGEDRLDALQRSFRRLHHRPSSVTVEAVAADTSAEGRERTRYLAVLLDAALRGQIVGPTAVRGSQRTPVTVIEQR